jgi:hypothetical protein
VVVEQTRDFTLVTGIDAAMFDSAMNVLALLNCPLREGLKVRFKNKSTQQKEARQIRSTATISHAKYSGSCSHAFIWMLLASLRRKISAFRRRSNTYSKNVPGLQRSLTLNCALFEYLTTSPSC